jgi:hypothetical protein
MENTLYPPKEIQLGVYYYFEDNAEQVCVFDEDEMRREFEEKLEELKNKFGRKEI